MNLEHEFTVPVSVDEAWKVLLDVERVAPCMPGATLLTVDGDSFTGTVKVKVGPIQVTYKGEAKFAELDENAHRAVIAASGKEARGSGTAAATVTAVLNAKSPSSTVVKVDTDLNVTGRPAQFGRGVMAEVGGKLVDQFAKCLAEELGSSGHAAASAAPASPTSSAPAAAPASTPAEAPAAAPPLPPTSAAPVEAAPAPAAAATNQSQSTARTVPPPRREAEPIDLLEVAGGSVAKRLAPVAAVVAVLLLLLWRRRRH